MFFGKKKKSQEKEILRSQKIAEGQNALLRAAIATADAAQEVTSLLKSRLDEIVEQFNHTARVLRDALIICDSNGQIQFFNSSAEELFGVSYKQALGSSITTFLKPSDGNVTTAGDLWIKLQNESEDDVLGVSVTGNTFSIRAGFSILERQGGASAVLLLIRRAEQNDFSRYASIFDTNFDGVILAKDGIITAANPACVRLFGYSSAAMINQPASMLVIEREKDRFLEILSDVHSNHYKNFMIEGITENCRQLSIVFNVTEIDIDSQLVALITLRDITEMKRLENIIAQKRDNGVDMSCVFDAQFKITVANKAFASRYDHTSKSIIGQDVRAFVSEDNFESDIKALTITNNIHRTYVESTNGFEDWIDHCIFDDRGVPLEYHRVGRSITDTLTTAIKLK